MQIDINDLIEAARPEFGKKLCCLMLDYVEKCKTKRGARLIENIIKNKLDSEAKKSFFRIVKRLVAAVL